MFFILRKSGLFVGILLILKLTLKKKKSNCDITLRLFRAVLLMRYPLYQGYCLLTNLFTIVIKRFAFLFSKHNRTNKLINKCSSTCFGWCSTWIRRDSKTYVYSHSMERPLVLFLWTFFYCHLQIYDLNRDWRFYVFWYLSKKMRQTKR
mgnify:CR=1 FL=1